MLEIITQNDTLVVDSRLIASSLEILHKNFVATINKYKDEIEAEFGCILFQTDDVRMPNGGIKQVFSHYLLTEDQSLYVMSLSKNTKAVRQCKINLIKSFSKAKEIIKSVLPQQSDRIRELELELLLAKEQNKLSESQTKLLATVQLLETVSPGLAPLALGRADAVVEKIEYVERVIDKSQDKVTEGVGITYLTKRFGFKNNNQTWQFLDSIGYGKDSGKWESQLTAIETPKLPKEALRELSLHFKNASRQLLLGE